MGKNNGTTAVDESSQTSKFEPLLTPREAAPLIGMHEKTVIALAREGKLPFIRMGKYWKTRQSWLDGWVETQLQSRHTSHGAWNERQS